MPDKPKLWERQPGETSPAWEARKIYIYMGPGRTQEQVGAEVNKGVGLMARWSGRWKWVASAKAYDDHLDAIDAKARRDHHEAEAKAKAAKWSRRDDQQPDFVYQVFESTYNDLMAIDKERLDKKKSKTLDKAQLLKNFAMMVSLASEARREMAIRLQGGGTIKDPGAENLGEAAKAALKAFNDVAFRDSNNHHPHAEKTPNGRPDGDVR